jgi:hypothetical protein
MKSRFTRKELHAKELKTLPEQRQLALSNDEANDANQIRTEDLK